MKTWILIAGGVGFVVVLLLVIFLLLPYLKIKSISKKYRTKWGGLTSEDQTNFTKLGWSKDKWDNVDLNVLTNYPDSYYKKMSELTDYEKKGAKGIGHNSSSWNLQRTFGFSKKKK